MQHIQFSMFPSKSSFLNLDSRFRENHRSDERRLGGGEMLECEFQASPLECSCALELAHRVVPSS